MAFFQLLVLKSLDIVDIIHNQPYQSIIITPGPQWDKIWSNQHILKNLKQILSILTRNSRSQFFKI